MLSVMAHIIKENKKGLVSQLFFDFFMKRLPVQSLNREAGAAISLKVNYF